VIFLGFFFCVMLGRGGGVDSLKILESSSLLHTYKLYFIICMNSSSESCVLAGEMVGSKDTTFYHSFC
jgi:hypothetical protein